MGRNCSHIATLLEAIYIQSCKCAMQKLSGRRQRTKKIWQSKMRFLIIFLLSQLQFFIHKLKQTRWIEMTKKIHIHKMEKSIYMSSFCKAAVSVILDRVSPRKWLFIDNVMFHFVAIWKLYKFITYLFN